MPETSPSVPLPLNYARRAARVAEPEGAAAEAPAPAASPTAQCYQDLCAACRIGDYDTVDTLLLTPNLNVNYVDEWDYSPLILASLCGHYRVVELLLMRGALCDRDTFEGARCIYGALNDEIRDLLLGFDVSKTVDILQPFASHISSLLNPAARVQSRDVVVVCRQQRFDLHRFLLAARSAPLAAVLAATASGDTVEVALPDAATFAHIVDYIYLGTDNIPVAAMAAPLATAARQFGLDALAEAVGAVMAAEGPKERIKVKNEHAVLLIERARHDLRKLLQTIIENKEVQPLDLREDVELEDIDVRRHLDDAARQRLAASFADVIVAAVDLTTECVHYFAVHRCILARLPYFETMFTSDIFLAQHRHERQPVVLLSPSTALSAVAEMVLSFLYHDDVDNIELALAVDLIFAANELFLDRLKTMAAVKVTSELSRADAQYLRVEAQIGYSVYDLVRVAWQTQCDRLEQHVTKLIAHHLRAICSDAAARAHLSSLVRESAARIRQRQDTDTIELVDDVRYYLLKKYGVNEMADFEPLQLVGEDVPDDIRIYKRALVDYERDCDLVAVLLDELDLNA